MADGGDELGDNLEAVEGLLLGEAPSLTRLEVAEQAGVPMEVAEALWRQLGFPHAADDDVAFTPADVVALRQTRDLIDLGILGPDRQAALVRTWGRSFARLAEWQTLLLADVAREAGAEPATQLEVLSEQVLPLVDQLQSYVWRRHLASAGSRMLAGESAGQGVSELAVCFADIVGYTSRSKSLAEAELVAWLEHFEDAATGIVVDHGGRIIKTIGDEVLFVADDVAAAAEIALVLTELGADDSDDFPAVRAGIAFGPVTSRLGDVYGPTVNIAARLTSVARPDTVLVDKGAYAALTGLEEDRADDAATHADAGSSTYRFRRMRRTSVKGYSRLHSWVLRRP
ncbi:adenylate cyclase [Nocardioides ginsengisegetis]|uniref:Adenylate cyclase n=1 Tax=Nocardioides ginsengisegetis TaxID=661491 RepID=A0A7W3J3F0_9ACTN|nr:adenylate cyclase [Nocardioides ginsengisegetis]